MPTKKYTDDQIEQAKAMRRYGATLREIGKELDMPILSVAYHVKGVPVDSEGHRVVYRKVDDIVTMFRPGTPFKELPLPRWMMRYLQGNSAAEGDEMVNNHHEDKEEPNGCESTEPSEN